MCSILGGVGGGKKESKKERKKERNFGSQVCRWEDNV